MDEGTSSTSRGRVLITGASVGGPAAAYWLDRTGWDVTVVERAPELRSAGQNIDVRGLARDVVERMGLLDAVKAVNTGEVGTRFVSDDGATVAEFPAGEGDEADGPTAELEVLRGELARVLVEACGEGVTWRFGDSITALDETDRPDGTDGGVGSVGGVEVTFESGTTERYDLVVVAEGARSRTRDLVLTGDERPELRRLDLCLAYATIPRTGDDDAWWDWMQAPGSRSVSLRPDNLGTTRAMLSIMQEEPVDFSGLDDAETRAWFRTRFDDLGWQTPRILGGMDTTDELYVDDLTQVVGDTWSKGRVVLLGDSAWCVTPIGGGGTSLALIAAYVLAAELSRTAPGEHPRGAFAAYTDFLRPLVDKAQKLPPGTPRLAHPRTRAGVTALRTATRVVASRPVQAVVGKISVSPGGEQTLPELA